MTENKKYYVTWSWHQRKWIVKEGTHLFKEEYTDKAEAQREANELNKEKNE